MVPGEVLTEQSGHVPPVVSPGPNYGILSKSRPTPTSGATLESEPANRAEKGWDTSHIPTVRDTGPKVTRQSRVEGLGPHGE